jgi:hypothetical protein
MFRIALTRVPFQPSCCYFIVKRNRFETNSCEHLQQNSIEKLSLAYVTKATEARQFARLRHFGVAPICRGKFARPGLASPRNVLRFQYIGLIQESVDFGGWFA